MKNPDWDLYSKLEMFRAVIDPDDTKGLKNSLVDRIQWNVLNDKLIGTNHLLDFGCGVGRFADRIEKLGINYFGVDSSAGMIEKARNLLPALKSSFKHFDGVHLPFEDHSFDTCLCCGVYQYCIYQPEHDLILREIKRVLRPNGRLLMIEQASQSNKSSGTVSHASTESDYRNVLSAHFHILDLKRVRSCELSHLSKEMIRFGRNFSVPFNVLLPALSALETKRIQKKSDEYLTKIDYYDIFIEAVANQLNSLSGLSGITRIYLFCNEDYGGEFIKVAKEYSLKYGMEITVIFSGKVSFPKNPFHKMLFQLKRFLKKIINELWFPISWHLPVFVVRNVNDPSFYKNIRKTDEGIVAGFNQIFKKEIINKFRNLVNFHASILPLYRGPVPSYWCIRNGEQKTGYTLHKVTERIDDGEILFQEEIPISENISPIELDKNISRYAAICFKKYLEHLKTNETWRKVKLDAFQIYKRNVSYVSFPNKDIN